MLRALAGSQKAPAVVVDVGFVNGLAAVRSLGRAGIPVLAVDHRPSALGLRSRYAIPVRCPDPLAEETAFAAFFSELGADLSAPAPVFATHDEPLNALARAQSELAARFRFPFPDAATVAAVQSKRTQLERAVEASVAIPATAHPRSVAEAEAAGGEIGYPLLVKPSQPVGFKQRFRQQAFRCDSPGELRDAYARAEPFEPMVQELVPGGDSELYTLGSHLGADGEVLALFCGRKLRQTPPLVGTCRVGEAVWVDEVVDAGTGLLRAFGFTGISQVELKRDARDGRFKLMEINPRLWQWHGLATACGVDVPVLAYRDLTGGRPLPLTSDGARRRWAIALVPHEPPIVVRPPDIEAVWARDDLRPVLTHVSRYVRNTLR